MESDHTPLATNVTQSLMCPLCGDVPKTARGLSVHAAKTHNITAIDMYVLRFPNASRTCKCGATLQLIDQDRGFKQRCGKCSRHEKTAGKPTWNAGLTKDTDARMATSADAMRAHYAKHGHHRAGRTKLNDPDVAISAQKISTRLSEHYKTHEHWSAGLSSDTSDVIARRSSSISAALTGVPFTDEHKRALALAKRLKHNDVQVRLRQLGYELVGSYVDMSTLTSIRCLKCTLTFERKTGAILFNAAKCPTCHPPWASRTSVWQQEIFDFVVGFCPDAILNDRKHLDGLELDIFVPSRNFGIECNGLYWHSELAGRFKPDHCEHKRLAALGRGTTLLFIFEDEWRSKRQIVESMIKHRLGITQRRLHARRLTVSRCSPSGVSAFIDSNHIDGNVRCSHAVKLTTQGGDIIGACTLRIAHHGSIAGSLEIARMCFAVETHIAGGVSRLVNEARKIACELGIKRLVSYADNRLGGACYATCMQPESTTVNRFWWTDGAKRYDRFNIRADSTAGITERQAAESAGVSRIYCCSNTRYSIPTGS